MDDDKARDAALMARRDFLTGLGAGVIGGGLVVAGVVTGTRVGIVSEVGTGKTKALSVPPSTGYILVDSQKCSGCRSCMMACALVHEGRENRALSRIQILNNAFGRYPLDISIKQCRQCVYPSCVLACPTGALHCDDETGVRLVNEGACIGCQRCVEACPQMPSRVVWNTADGTAAKCDLCTDAKYWNERGGPNGTQACVEVCPMKAIRFAGVVPAQMGTVGYDINLKSAKYMDLVAVTTNTATPQARTAPPPASAGARHPEP
jgi:protein NrfC